MRLSPDRELRIREKVRKMPEFVLLLGELDRERIGHRLESERLALAKAILNGEQLATFERIDGYEKRIRELEYRLDDAERRLQRWSPERN